MPRVTCLSAGRLVAIVLLVLLRGFLAGTGFDTALVVVVGFFSTGFVVVFFVGFGAGFGLAAGLGFVLDVARAMAADATRRTNSLIRRFFLGGIFISVVGMEAAADMLAEMLGEECGMIVVEVESISDTSAWRTELLTGMPGEDARFDMSGSGCVCVDAAMAVRERVDMRLILLLTADNLKPLSAVFGLASALSVLDSGCFFSGIGGFFSRTGF
ncbi:hypothetical protein ABW21_db0203497 [Orbilia brochopaga]|nr:hypothetical protein ABW21_db0203497 [Drechslerella brochopaga]